LLLIVFYLYFILFVKNFIQFFTFLLDLLREYNNYVVVVLWKICEWL